MAQADAVFLEADGAKHFPCKAPAEQEPVLLPQSNIVLAVAGLSALGRPLKECCFRLEQACMLLGVSPERCAAIEDSPNGLLSAKRAGMIPIMIPDLIPPDRQDSARFCFSSMDELHRVWQADGGAFLDAPASCGAV